MNPVKADRSTNLAVRAGRFLAGLAAMALIGLSAGSASAAQDVTKWSGVWKRVGSYNFDPSVAQKDVDKPPYTPKYAALAKQILASAAEGKPINDAGSRCLPNGGVMMMLNVYPMEIIGTPNQITFIAEYLTQVRRVYIGGKHPDDVDPSFNGHSVGHWEGDVLVVDTIGFKENPTLTRGLPLGPDLHLVERMRLKDPDTFVNEMTVSGPAFTKPWTVTRVYKRTPDIQMMEYLCENNRNPMGDNGVTGVTLQEGDSKRDVFVK